MSSPNVVLPASQAPRICHIPASAVSFELGHETVELAELAGLFLDPWQQFVIVNGMAQDSRGKYAAFEVGFNVARQNGKGGILEARELAGLFLIEEPMQIHSAHQFDTSLEAFRRLLHLIEATPELDRRVQRVSRSHGEEGIELKGGARIRFRTRTKGGGRGFTGKTLYLDEDMILPIEMVGALMPVVSAVDDAQIWYSGSAVDQNVHEHGLVSAGLRQRAIKGDDPSLAYFEWSVDEDTPDDVPPSVAVDPAAWAQANPALGIRISAEHVANEQRSMDHRTFAVERLGVGDWPSLDGLKSVLDLEKWNALTDAESSALDPVCLSFDVSEDRSWATISAAGKRADELAHVETVERRRGTGWVVPRLAELVAAHRPVGIVFDGNGPAASLLQELEQEQMGVELLPVTATEHGNACGLLFDMVEQAKLRHLGTAELAAAVKGAASRPMGEKWAWSRRTSAVDISPLVAATLAVWGLSSLSGVQAWVGW